MNELAKKHHPVKHANSVKYAFQGIFHALINEANFRVQVVLAIFAVVVGFYFGISNTEWGLLILSMGFLLSAEMVNTVVENVIDHLIKDYHEGAKIIKDLSAGFVLIAAVTTLLIMALVFGPYFLELLSL